MEIAGLLVILGGMVLWMLLMLLRVRWRLASLPFPIGFMVGGLMTRWTDFAPFWAELLLWGWLGISNYAVLLFMGHIGRPWFEEQGRRW